MAINSTPKEKPTVDTNSTVDRAINDLDFPTGQQPSKAFEILRAAYAMRGHSLHRTDPANGQVTFWAERWGQVRYLPTLHDVTLFLTRFWGRV